MTCPRCGNRDAWTFCWSCSEYVESNVVTDVIRDMPKDDRSEDQRKADARPAVEALGWTILDMEQGFRPFTCKHCGGDIAGGTRVPKGFADWVVIGHGVTAFVEWKTDTNYQTASQKRFMELCDKAGVPYAVVRNTKQCVDWLERVRGAA